MRGGLASRTPQGEVAPSAPTTRTLARPVAAQEFSPHEFAFRAEARLVPKDERAPLLVPRSAVRPPGERARAPAPPRPARDAQQVPQPDEIHINIGRVEVVAAPQPQPRVAAPAHKATSLEDYLRDVSARRR
jgi:hypothetical protein